MDFGGERVEFYSPDIYRQVLGELGFDDVRVEYFMASQIAKLAYAQFELFLVIGGVGLARVKHKKLREFFFDFVKCTVVPLLSVDRELCSSQGKGLNIFVTARKRGVSEEGSGSGANILDHLACPQCKSRLVAKRDTYSCLTCGLTYPVVDSMPLLIPFYAEGYKKIVEIRSDRDSYRANYRGKISHMKKTLIKVPYLYRLYQVLKNRV